MSKEGKRSIPIKITKGPDYRVFYGTGAFGGLNPLEGRMIFYLDRPVPKMKELPSTAMETLEIERELQVEVHLSTAAFLNMYQWMARQVERMEKSGALVKVKQEGPE